MFVQNLQKVSKAKDDGTQALKELIKAHHVNMGGLDNGSVATGETQEDIQLAAQEAKGDAFDSDMSMEQTSSQKGNKDEEVILNISPKKYKEPKD